MIEVFQSSNDGNTVLDIIAELGKTNKPGWVDGHLREFATKWGVPFAVLQEWLPEDTQSETLFSMEDPEMLAMQRGLNKIKPFQLGKIPRVLKRAHMEALEKERRKKWLEEILSQCIEIQKVHPQLVHSIELRNKLDSLRLENGEEQDIRNILERISWGEEIEPSVDSMDSLPIPVQEVPLFATADVQSVRREAV